MQKPGAPTFTIASNRDAAVIMRFELFDLQDSLLISYLDFACPRIAAESLVSHPGIR